MTPKEKAYELCYKFMICNSYQAMVWHNARICAEIAVDEMIGEYQSMSDLESILVINNKRTFVVHQLVYWQEVKQEINLI
jgi:hypothetical protein